MGLMLRSAAVFAFGLSVLGCTKQPASIRIKGPKDAVESTKMNPVFAPFEKKGDTLQLRASAFDDQDRYMGTVNASWESSARDVATVNQNGLVEILGSGKVKITAKSMETKPPLEASIDLEAKIVKGIRMVDPPEDQAHGLTMAMGQIKQFKVEVLNDKDQVIPDAKVEWQASSYAVTVTPTGEVEARAIGTAQVVAEAENGSVARFDIEVTDWEPTKKKKNR
jgi:hypothetical protein